MGEGGVLALMGGGVLAQQMSWLLTQQMSCLQLELQMAVSVQQSTERELSKVRQFLGLNGVSMAPNSLFTGSPGRDLRGGADYGVGLG